MERWPSSSSAVPGPRSRSCWPTSARPGGRLALNLGHSLGHGFEAAAGYGERLLHGEAVAFGLRAACRIGLELGVTPADRAARIEALLTELGLAPVGGLAVLDLDRSAVLDALAGDKKHAGGRLRWVLPSAGGVEEIRRSGRRVDRTIVELPRRETDLTGMAGVAEPTTATDAPDAATATGLPAR